MTVVGSINKLFCLLIACVVKFCDGGIFQASNIQKTFLLRVVIVITTKQRERDCRAVCELISSEASFSKLSNVLCLKALIALFFLLLR